MVPEKKEYQNLIRFKTIVYELPILICCYLPSGEILFVNEAYCNYFDKTSDELVGSNFLSLIPDADRKTVMDNISALTVDSPTQSHDHSVITPKGDIGWQRWINHAIFDVEGKIVEYHSTGEDITERKLAEKMLMESEELHRITLSNISDAVFITDEAGFFTYICPNAEVIFGYSYEEVKAIENIEKLLGGQLFDPYELKSSGELKNVEHIIHDKSGLAHNLLVNIKRVSIKGGTFLYTCRDITTRMQSEATLRKSEDRFRKIFENAVMGIAITDWKGCFLQCNPAYCNLLGYTEEELYRIEFDALIHPEDREANMAEIHRLESGELPSFNIKNRYVHKNGKLVWVHKFVSIMHDEMGQPAHLMILVNDITNQIQAKDKLRRLNETLVERTNLAEQRAVYIQQLAMDLSQAEDRERQRLASVLHEDLQQMLAYLKIKLTTLHASVDRAKDISEQSNLIDQCIDRCRNLAHELKPFDSIRNDFLSALKLLSRQMKEMYGLEVVLRTADDPGIQSPVLSSLLLRSIRELLFNVIKHSGVNYASIDIWVDGRQMLISIKDTGRGCDIGILREKKENNAAFGLFDIEDRVSFLGGSMNIESQSGMGFCVTLWVPRDLTCHLDKNQPATDTSGLSPLKPDAPAVAPVDSGAGRSISVLLADDHRIMRDGLAELINGQDGIEVVGLAVNGQEAVELAVKLRPDVILMDVSMPVMSGIDATQQICNLLPEIRIIGLTMHKDPDIRQAMLNAGACACLLKSGSPTELIKTIQQKYSDNLDPL